MELVDVADSKSADGDIMWVRVPPPAPNKKSSLCCSFLFAKVGENPHRVRCAPAGAIPRPTDACGGSWAEVSHRRHQKAQYPICGCCAFLLCGEDENPPGEIRETPRRQASAQPDWHGRTHAALRQSHRRHQTKRAAYAALFCCQGGREPTLGEMCARPKGLASRRRRQFPRFHCISASICYNIHRKAVFS